MTSLLRRGSAALCGPSLLRLRPAARRRARAATPTDSALDWLSNELAANGHQLGFKGAPQFTDWGLTIDFVLALAGGGRATALGDQGDGGQRPRERGELRHRRLAGKHRALRRPDGEAAVHDEGVRRGLVEPRRPEHRDRAARADADEPEARSPDGSPITARSATSATASVRRSTSSAWRGRPAACRPKRSRSCSRSSAPPAASASSTTRIRPAGPTTRPIPTRPASRSRRSSGNPARRARSTAPRAGSSHSRTRAARSAGSGPTATLNANSTGIIAQALRAAGSDRGRGQGGRVDPVAAADERERRSGLGRRRRDRV